MNKTVLANLVWSHLGQEFTNLNDNSLESKILNQVFDSAKRTIILKVAPESFTMPFIPSRLDPQPAEGDAFFGWQIFNYPVELIQLYKKPNFNPLTGALGIDPTQSIMRAAYSKELNRKILIYSGSDTQPVREGIIDVPLELWNDQIAETLALYIAWMLSPSVQQSVQKRKDLKREFEQSKMETISINNFEGDKEPLIQQSSVTNIIDFNQDFNLNFYLDNVL